MSIYTEKTKIIEITYVLDEHRKRICWNKIKKQPHRIIKKQGEACETKHSQLEIRERKILNKIVFFSAKTCKNQKPGADWRPILNRELACEFLSLLMWWIDLPAKHSQKNGSYPTNQQSEVLRYDFSLETKSTITFESQKLWHPEYQGKDRILAKPATTIASALLLEPFPFQWMEKWKFSLTIMRKP